MNKFNNPTNTLNNGNTFKFTKSMKSKNIIYFLNFYF